jgi:hypothetical protein
MSPTTKVAICELFGASTSRYVQQAGFTCQKQTEEVVPELVRVVDEVKDHCSSRLCLQHRSDVLLHLWAVGVAVRARKDKLDHTRGPRIGSESPGLAEWHQFRPLGSVAIVVPFRLSG